MHPESAELFIRTFSKGKEFLADAISYLKEQNIEAEFGNNYRIKPETAAYKSFLAFLIEELQSLPFDNQVGETFEIRSDSREVVDRLTQYLNKKLTEVSQTGAWDNSDLGEIEDVFHGHNLEIFKNKIYPNHNMEGIGYSLDLSASNGIKPSEIVLERRLITNQDNFKVTDHGFLKLNVQTGTVTMDLDEFETRNVHMGNEETY